MPADHRRARPRLPPRTSARRPRAGRPGRSPPARPPTLRQGPGPAGLLPRPGRLRLHTLTRHPGRPRRQRHRRRSSTASGATASSSPARSRPWPASSASRPGSPSGSPRAISDPTDPSALRGQGRARPRLARGLPRPVRVGAVRADARARGNPNARPTPASRPQQADRRRRRQTTTTTTTDAAGADHHAQPRRAGRPGRPLAGVTARRADGSDATSTVAGPP